MSIRTPYATPHVISDMTQNFSPCNQTTRVWWYLGLVWSVTSPMGISQARASNCKHIRLASLPDTSAFPRVRNKQLFWVWSKIFKEPAIFCGYEGLFKARAIIYVDPPFPLLLTFLVEPYISKVTKRFDGDRSCGSLCITQADQIAYKSLSQ
jgi:hypothetical protein